MKNHLIQSKNFKTFKKIDNLWSLRHYEVSQNTLLDVIDNLKTWDYSIYCTKNPFLRDVVFNALENDINSVINDNKFNNKKSLQLFKEFESLKKLFTEFDNRQKNEYVSEQTIKLKTNRMGITIEKNSFQLFAIHLIKQEKIINKTKNKRFVLKKTVNYQKLSYN